MKRSLTYVVLAAALSAFCACEKKQDPAPTPVEEVKLTPSALDFKAEGGTADVLVSSSSAWTLSPGGEYDWVSASKSSGEDGDVVTFTVQANTDAAGREARFTVSVSEATSAELLVTCAGVPIPDRTFTLSSEPVLSLGHEAGKIEVRLKASDNSYREFKHVVDEEAASWLTFDVALEDGSDNEGRLIFSYSALTGLEDRKGGIDFSVDGVEAHVRVEVTQYAEHVLSLGQDRYSIAKEGGSITIPVRANVAYSVSISPEGTDWLSKGEAGEEGIPFTATALESGKRSATVTFTQTDAAEGEAPLSARATLTQQAVVIEWAAEMRGNRLYPKWSSSSLPSSMNAFTLETMLYVDEFKTTEGEISTVMGVENEFLLRFGDVGVSPNRLQVAAKNSIKFEVPFDFSPKVWYHLAVTFGSDTLKVYVDGVNRFESEVKSSWGYSQTYNLCVNWQTYLMATSLGRTTHPFMIGYSWEPGRDLYGKLTEIRFWNKALTSEEINADGHFYSVDSKSDGLYAYWKFTGGSGGTIADATGKSDAMLYGEVGTTSAKPSDASSISWVAVSLPDR